MDGNQFLKLTPEEGRPYVFKSSMGVQRKVTGQGLALRRIPSLENLKSKTHNDAAGYRFLKLTPDPRKSIRVSNNDKAAAKGGDGKGTYKPSRVESTSVSGHERRRVSSMTVVRVGCGVQPPPRRFNERGISADEAGAKDVASKAVRKV